MSLPPVYLATINTPGYLPMADEPAAFDTAREAWGWLAGERERDEDGATEPLDTGEYSDTLTYLRHAAGSEHVPGNPHEDYPTDIDRCGVVDGHTPGHDGDYDQGIAYSVTRVDHAAYPHPAGYMTNCPACLARCYCDGESARCVYQGEHHV